ncbi:DNA polymerase, partial [Corynebacterium amycolatum]|uniref:DNA polymerase n=1 Tax=Corynebacterium amycolatum TaxID=43765 RepID=UPI00211A545F
YFNDQVCILTLVDHLKDIRDISGYTDLRILRESPIQSISVLNPEIKYLLKYNGHLGVIFNLKRQKNIGFTSYDPLSVHGRVERITVCFDIETYFDPQEEKDQTHIPYLCCFCFTYNDVVGDILEFEGRDCVAQMIEYISKSCKKLRVKEIELVAHNGGAYDFHYILSSMHNPSIINNILIRNNSFISFTFIHENVTFNVKDSYSFLLCSLSNAAKAFDVSVGKTDFPHHEVKQKKDLLKVFQKWLSVDNIIDSTIEKENMIIDVRHVINYQKDGDSRKLIDWAKDYCCNDVIEIG